MYKKSHKKLLKHSFITLFSLNLLGYLGFWNIGKSHLFTSQNYDFQFTEVPMYGRDLKMMHRQHESWKERHQLLEHEYVIHRTFKKNYLKFWKWSEFVFHERWQYPYIELPPEGERDYFEMNN